MSAADPVPGDRGRAVTRRTLLTALGLTAVTGAACTAARPVRHAGPVTSSMSSTPSPDSPVHYSYGTDGSQWGELFMPVGRVPRATVVVIHGGFWRSAYGADLGSPLGADLATRGYAAWNIEYRRVGNGGGWPETFDDVASAIDLLATIATQVPGLSTKNVIALGHSAGGQLATWAAHRQKLPPAAPGSRPKITLSSVVSQAGVLDLRTALAAGTGGSAVSDLMGSSPAQQPERYLWADPQQQIPLAVPVHCVHARGDQNVPFSQSADYVAAATAARATAVLHEVPGDHFSLIDVTSPAWHTIVGVIEGLS